jgi:FixJ family two-component response regulator
MARLVALIDDDNSVRESLQSLIRSAGFTVRAFDTAEQFLNSPRLQEAVCLVLDVRLPGMSGTELYRHMLSNGCKLPVIFMTAHATDEEARMQALANGALAYLIKPFDEGELLAAIHRAILSESRQDD